MSTGRGVFQKLLHEIDDDDRVLDFYGIPVWFARCDFPCSIVYPGVPVDGVPLCCTCFPDGPVDETTVGKITHSGGARHGALGRQ